MLRSNHAPRTTHRFKAPRTAHRFKAPRTTHSRSGFTLVELLVALALTGAVALLAHNVFVGVADAAARLEGARLALDRETNARRTLQQLAGSIEVGTEGTGGFTGETDRVEFATWVLVDGGWLERHTVTIARDDTRLTVTGPGAKPLVLGDGVTDVAFDYLLGTGANEHWMRVWRSTVSAPLAIRMRVAGCGKRDAGCADTLLLIVGTRG